MRELHAIQLTVNGVRHERSVEPRLLLSDFLRQDLELTGTHIGCEHGVCGACTVLMDGEAVRSCLMFAVQADGADITTVEGLAEGTGEGFVGSAGGVEGAGEGLLEALRLHPLQAAFRDAHALQCGFCTPGVLLTLIPFLEENPDPDEREIREALSGNLCRCTGYQTMVEAVMALANGGGRPDGHEAAEGSRSHEGVGP